MPQYLNQVTVASPRNGTTSHTGSAGTGTVVSGTSFTPTAGRLLICVASASGTLTTATGWSRPYSATAGTLGSYVFYRYAAGTAADDFPTTASIADVPAVFAFFEFPFEYAFLPGGDGGVALSGIASGSSGGAVTNPSPTETVPAFGCAFQLSNDDTGAFSTFTWDTGTEVVDTGVGRNGTGGTDGYALGITYLDNMTGATFAFIPTLTRTTPTSNRIYFAVYRRLVRSVSSGSTSATAPVDAIAIGGFGATTVAGDIFVASVAIKPASATVTLPAAAVTDGWQLVTEGTNGTDPSGLDTGSMRVQVYAKRYPATTLFTLLQSGADSISSVQVNLRGASGYTAWDVTAATTGGDTTDGTTFAATGSADLALAADDFMVVSEAMNSDTASITGAITPSAPSALFSKVNAAGLRQGTSTVGNQSRITSMEAAVVGGPSTGPPSITHNLSAVGSGAVAFVRLRVAAPVITTWPVTGTGTGTSVGSAAATVSPAPLPVYASGDAATFGSAAATVLLSPVVSSASTVPSVGTWLTATNVFSSNDVYATNVGTTQNTEYPMDVAGFSFAAIPAGATVNTVTVLIEAKTGTAARAQIKGELYDGATLISGALALTNLTAADANYTFTPTPTLTQLKSAGLLVRVTNKRTVSQASTTSVDYVRISVSYTPAAAAAVWPVFAGGGGDSSGSAAATVVTAPAGPVTWAATATGSGVSVGSGATALLAQASSAGTGVSAGSAAATVSTGAVVYQGTATGTGVSAGSAAVTLLAQAGSTGTGVSVGSAAVTVLARVSATGSGVSVGSGAATLLARVSATGTGISTGSAAVVPTLTATATGTGLSVGSAAAGLLVQATGTGAGISTGSAAAAVSVGAVAYQVTATGTGVSTGSAAVVPTITASATGAGISTGSAAVLPIVTATTTGTGLSTGSAAFTVLVRVSATGTGISAGSATAVPTITATAAGTGVSAGSAAVTAQITVSATGTGVSVGSATVTLLLSGTTTGTGTSVGSAAVALLLTVSAAGSGTTLGYATVGSTLGTAGWPKVWNGAAWVPKPAKVWTGAVWATKPMKVWTGTSWKLVNIPGA